MASVYHWRSHGGGEGMVGNGGHSGWVRSQELRKDRLENFCFARQIVKAINCPRATPLPPRAHAASILAPWLRH